MKQIISIGGGGFARPEKGYDIEKYLIEQSGKANPNICFLPQASAEDWHYTTLYYQCFNELGAKASWQSFFGRVENGWEDKLLSQDIIYVGGGNTKSMIAVWRNWGVDEILKKAYEKGILLCGVSAGAICWFEDCITDSVWPLGVTPGLGLLPGSCCPHYNGEPERKPAYIDMVKSTEAKPGIAIEDYALAHYIDGKLARIQSFAEGKTAYFIDESGEQTIQT